MSYYLDYFICVLLTWLETGLFLNCTICLIKKKNKKKIHFEFVCFCFCCAKISIKVYFRFMNVLIDFSVQQQQKKKQLFFSSRLFIFLCSPACFY